MATKYEIVKAFIDKLGDIENWDYYGDFYTNDKKFESCVCGHPIRNVYVIENKKSNRKEKVGSTCINHFKGYNEDLYNKLCVAEKERIEKVKAEKKAKEDLENNKEYAELKKEIRRKRAVLLQVKDTWGGHRIPSDLYWALHTLVVDCPKTYKRTASYVKWAKKQNVLADNYLSQCDEWSCTEPLPEPAPVSIYDGTIWFGKHKDKKVEDLPKDYLGWLVRDYVPTTNNDKENDFYTDVCKIYAEMELKK